MKVNRKLKLIQSQYPKKDLTQSWNNRYYPINNPSNSEIKSQYIKSQQNINELPILNSTQTLNLVQSKKNKNENLNEELINIWNDLGVSEDYREQFIMYIENLKENEKKEFLDIEISNLNKFRNYLLKLSNEIKNREKFINDLKKFDKIIESTFNNNNLNNSILTDVQNTIKLLRKNSINIVSYINKIKEISSYNSERGKYNLHKLNSAYLYDENYLIKMKTDMNFLNNSNISKYIEMSNDEPNTFFTNCDLTEENNLDNNFYEDKITIPINDDLKKPIIKSKFSIMEDILCNNIRKNNEDNENILYKKINDNNKSNYISKTEENVKRNFSSRGKRVFDRSKFSNNYLYEKEILKSKNLVNKSLNKKKEENIYSYNNTFKKKKLKLKEMMLLL